LDIELFIDRFADAIEYEGTAMLDPDTPFNAVENWDSLAALSTIAMIFSEYGVEVSGRELKSCEKIGDMIEVVIQKTGAQQT
jgi:acyl carrier protein